MEPADRWQRTRAHLEEALDLSAAEREAYLDRVCEDDLEMRREIDELLAADASDTRVLPGEQETVTWLQGHVASMLRGTTIGSCRIIRVLGSGGMGTVYEAEQDHPKRTVALKVMRPGNDEELHLEYFHREAELLASLRHPHVAQVYSAGVHEETVDGRVVRMAYMVMEPVEDALDLVTYANRHELDTRARVRLFLDVADALGLAHRRGLVHRDVKPSNLLVDGHGNVKVIDFGIARMIGSAPSETESSGTMRYMSPEQKGDAPSLDVRTDVYSLGVVLDELLPVTDQELQWILAKAKHPDPELRYDHAGDLAQDLRRRLTEEPVFAAPPSRGYRLRKFVRRHRLAVAAAAIVFISAVAGVGGLAMGYVEAAAQRETAEARASEAEAVVEFIQNMLVASQPWHGGREVTVREFLESSGKNIDEEFADEPGVAAVLHLTVGWALRGIGKPHEAEASLRRAVELMETLPSVRVRQKLVAQHRFAAVVSEVGRTAEAAELIADVAERATELLGKDDDLTRAALDLQALCLSALGRPAEAVVIMQRLIEISDRQHGADSKASMAHRNNLVGILIRLGRYEEAAEQSELTEATMIKRFGLDHVDTLVTMQNRAALLYFTGKFVESEELTRKTLEHRATLLGAEHTHSLISRYWLGSALNGQKRFAEARVVLEQLLPIIQRVQGADHTYVLKTEIEIAKALDALGEQAEAIRIVRGVKKRLEEQGTSKNQRLWHEVRALLGESESGGK